MNELDKRQYLAISIKHTEHGFKYGSPVTLWGNRRTADEEPRCYAGYTENPHQAELYSISEFAEAYNKNSSIYKFDEPIKPMFGFVKKYKKYDTVFVKENVYLAYCDMCGLDYEKSEVANGDKE